MKRNMSCLANVLRYAEYGEPGKVLKLCSETLAAPQNGNLLVKILLAPINPADINTIQGKFKCKAQSSCTIKLS
jgi:mitochondrial enoyl-[acyl-carrier protein] reductase / trans-2-enoyl-CoA reductase